MLNCPGIRLDSSDLLFFTSSKFKLPPTLNSNRNVNSSTSDGSSASRHQLGPFARMMLDSTDIAYRCEIERHWLCLNLVILTTLLYRPRSIVSKCESRNSEIVFERHSGTKATVGDLPPAKADFNPEVRASPSPIYSKSHLEWNFSGNPSKAFTPEISTKFSSESEATSRYRNYGCTTEGPKS